MQQVLSGRARIAEIHEANFLMAGQSTSRRGSVVGVRLILEGHAAELREQRQTLVDEIKAVEREPTEQEERGLEELLGQIEIAESLEVLSEIIRSSTIEGSTNNFTVWSVEPLSELEFDALPMYRAEELGETGVFTLSVEFSDGWGATTAKGVKVARENQAKETKNTLDLCKDKYNSSKANPFMSNEALSLSVKEPRWFLVKKLANGEVPAKASGGCYQFSYDLRGTIDRLVDASEGTWWKPMTMGDSTLTVDCRDDLGIPENPMKWFHKHEESKSRFEERIGEAVGVEERRSNDGGLIDDMRYIHKSIVGCEPPLASLGMEEGAFPGDERDVVRKILRDWVVREFFHLMHSFLMIRNPQFWMNGRSEVRIFSGSLQ